MSGPSTPIQVPRLPTAVWVAAGLFAILFGAPAVGLARQWWTDPDAGAGLLLAPVAVWLMWREGLAPDRKPIRWLGTLGLLVAVAIRYLSTLGAELFTMRMSMLLGAGSLVVFFLGVAQLRRWWLGVSLLALSVPLPDVILSALAFPLQFKASEMGAALLRWRQIPVNLDGNIIVIPGHRLFVTEACSGLRSLSALVSLGLLSAGLWLRLPAFRTALLVITLPIAILINGVRVFLTGFLVFFVDPKLGEGFMHLTEGWLMFLVAFGLVGVTTWALGGLERSWQRRFAADV